MSILLSILGVLAAALGLTGLGYALALAREARPPDTMSITEVEKKVQDEATVSNLADYLNRRS